MFLRIVFGLLSALVIIAPLDQHNKLYMDVYSYQKYTENSCHSPPAGFNPMKATNAEIMYYGLPPRPQGSGSQLDHWVDVINHSKSRICNPAIEFIKYHDKKQSFGSTFIGGPYAYSDIWSGYMVDQGGMDETFSDWNVPCYSKFPTGATAASWVGLGGFYNDNLWQAGTFESPKTGYYFWWEAFPTQYAQVITNFVLGCGDQVAVDVNYNRSCSNQSFAYMDDYTADTYFSTGCVNFTPDTNTSEWIDERPSILSGNSYCTPQLLDFGQVSWYYSTAYSTWYGNTMMRINQYNDLQIVMTNNGLSGTSLASPGGISSNNGGSFTDYWQSPGTSNC